MGGVEIGRQAMEDLLYRVRRDELEDTSERLKERCEANSPIGETRHLHDSHEVIPVNADATEAGVENTARYAAAAHEGARAHIIPNAFGRGESVEHPGNEPDPWMRRSVDEMAAENL
jgi:hypothetical protein